MSLQVERLSKRSGNTWVLRDASFDVDDGEVFGIVGGSGSGRSEMLKCIAGSEKANGGSVTLNGRSILDLPSRSRDLSFIDDGRGRSKLGRSLFRSKNISDSEYRSGLIEKSANDGRAAIVIDDPFSGTDPLCRRRITEMLRQFADSGKLVLVGSPDLEDLAPICDRVAVIVKGEILQTGHPSKVYEHPASTAVARATGDINLLPVRRLTSTKAESPEFVTIDGNVRLFAQPTEAKDLGPINKTIHLAIRPEQLSISFGASFPEDNLLKAAVTEIRYCGATTFVDLAAGELKLVARVFRIVGLSVGDECMVAIPPDRLIVLQD